MWTRAPRHTGVAAAAHGPDMEFDAKAARAYIRGVRWQFARTMPQWPHEYTVRDWCLELEPEFIAFAALIRRDGTSKPWPPEAGTPRYRNTYLELDGREYWTMGSPIPATTVINRAHLARPPRGADRLNDRSAIGEPPGRAISVIGPGRDWPR
jgi:hypothetical protein